MKIIVDSYAWIELFSGTDKGKIVKEKLSEANEVYTPDIVLAEIARKYYRENFDSNTIEERLSKICEISRIVSVDKDIALKAADLDKRLKDTARNLKLREPSLFDAIILAFAETLEANLITGDMHFKGKSKVIWIGE
ncbi:MAG: PIN domain-containing protein [Nitrososphaeria archaeon]